MQKLLTFIATIVFLTAGAFSAQADEVVATLNGKKIMSSELDNYVQYREAITQKKIDNKVGLLNELINREIMYAEAVKNKIDKDEKLNYLIKQQKYDLFIQSMLTKTDVAKPVPDADVQKIYDEKIKNQNLKEYKVRHIIVKTTEADAKTLIAELDKGSNFEELAKQKSEGPSASAGGDIGWLNMGQMSNMPAFAQAVSEMKKGEYTKTPVKTDFGWHVIKLDDIRDVEPPALEKVKPQIVNAIRQQRMAEYVRGLREKQKIDIKLK
jgi:peptidyl-prolyl cis-trans isomerase C